MLATYSGTDATIAFEDFGHTQDARDLGEQYVIGSVVGQVSLYCLSCSDHTCHLLY